MSPPQSDPEFYSVTYRAAGARAGRRMGKNAVLIQWGQSSAGRNKTTFLPLSLAAVSPGKPQRLQQGDKNGVHFISPSWARARSLHTLRPC